MESFFSSFRRHIHKKTRTSILRTTIETARRPTQHHASLRPKHVIL
jgi:hypothetical protein